ncbi:Transcriptional regulatory protein sin3 [Glugoides intestinalis]
MSSESEKLQVSTEYETGKKQVSASDTSSKRIRHIEEQQMRYHPGVRPVSPHPMMYRHGVDTMMMRQPIPRPISPRAPHTEDSDLTDAMIFLNRIKEEFSDNLHVYDNFLETMRDFRFEKIDAEEVCKAVRILFKDKPHFIKLFDEYLPHHLRFPDTRYDMQGNERAKTMPYRGHGFIHRPPTPIHMAQIPINTTAMHMARMAHQIPPHPSFIGRQIRKSPPPMGAHQESMQKIRTMPPPLVATSQKQMTAPREFVHDVKKRYQNKPLIYRQFLDILQNPNSSFEKLYTQVSALLCDSPDLVEKFEKTFRTSQTSPGKPLYTADNDPLKKIKQKLAEQGNLKNFLKIINFYNQNYLAAEDVIALVEPLIADKENMASFKAFLRYEEKREEAEVSKPKEMERIGSYKILPSSIHMSNSESLSKEVLNYTCISVSTHDSEDDTYVFRNKNCSEELLARIIDERSEADLVIDRLKFLIIKFEEIYASVGDGELDLKEVKMSSSLVKETLECIYDNKTTEILEAMLINPKKSLPVILKRLNKVFKDNLERLREFKKFWREVVAEQYYKAYDTKGVHYSSQERNYLSLKYIQNEASTTHRVSVTDLGIFGTIRKLFRQFIACHSSSGSRRPATELQVQILDSMISELSKEDLNTVVCFNTYALYYYVLMLYVRFQDIKSLTLEPITANPIAVIIGMQENINIEDRYSEVIRAAEDLMNKVIDADRFEEVLRRMTDSMGYKLYNLKRLMSKIERQVNTLAEQRQEGNQEEGASKEKYSIIKRGNEVAICAVREEETDIENKN